MTGEWQHLPFSKNQLNDCLARININEQYEEYFFSDYECSISEIRRILGEYENIFILNKLAERLVNGRFIYGDGISIKRYEEEQEIIDEQLEELDMK